MVCFSFSRFSSLLALTIIICTEYYHLVFYDTYKLWNSFQQCYLDFFFFLIDIDLKRQLEVLGSSYDPG